MILFLMRMIKPTHVEKGLGDPRTTRTEPDRLVLVDQIFGPFIPGWAYLDKVRMDPYLE